MPSDEILLSICVPTFNRAAMLERNLSFHLEAFRARGIGFELVVVDDCSTDGTAAYLAGLRDTPELSAYRRQANSGFLSNYAFAMRRARGRYAVFLGDDDLLIPDQVMACLDLLRADPALVMVQAPWLCVDERPGAGDIGPFYVIPSEVRIGRGRHDALASLVFDHHVFPEFMIIRRDALARSISSPCPFIFWAFLFTARALGRGDILFRPEPFARVTAVSADPRLQQGNKETMFQWDHYRGGVEYIASLARREGAVEDLGGRIQAFMAIRLKVALRLHIEAGNWADAYILHHRIAAHEAPPLPPELFAKVCQLAGMTTAATEASAFAAAPVLLDPMVTDDLLLLLQPDLRARMARAAVPADPPGPRAHLRLDPAFPAATAPGDAVFDLADYIAQFA